MASDVPFADSAELKSPLKSAFDVNFVGGMELAKGKTNNRTTVSRKDSVRARRRRQSLRAQQKVGAWR